MKIQSAINQISENICFFFKINGVLNLKVLRISGENTVVLSDSLEKKFETRRKLTIFNL
jgi:hypothetical protein